MDNTTSPAATAKMHNIFNTTLTHLTKVGCHFLYDNY